MAKQRMSLLEESVNYLLEEGNEGESENTADSSTADSGENTTYAKSLKALQESKKRLLKAEDESLGGDSAKKIKSALGAVDSAIEAIQQEMDGDGDGDEGGDDTDGDGDGKKKPVAEEGKGKKKKLQQNADGDDKDEKPKGDDEDKPKEEGKGKKKLQKNEDGDEPTFGGSEDDLNEESDDGDEDDEGEEGDVKEEGKPFKGAAAPFKKK